MAILGWFTNARKDLDKSEKLHGFVVIYICNLLFVVMKYGVRPFHDW